MLLPADDFSSMITSFALPEGVEYAVLHDRLCEAGLVIYAGLGRLSGRTFRIATMGEIARKTWTAWIQRRYGQPCRSCHARGRRRGHPGGRLGNALGQLGEQLPKGFLQLDGLPIVEQSILRLRQAGMSRIVIVTGHLSEFYLDLQTRYPKLIETVHNPALRRIGEHGLAVGGPAVAGRRFPAPRIGPDLRTPSAGRVPGVSARECRAVVRTDGFARRGVHQGEGWPPAGHVKRPRASRGRDPGRAGRHFENFAHRVQTMLEVSERIVSAAGHFRFHYETDALVAAAALTPVYCLLVPDLVWAEIDDYAHLERARSLIYPSIATRDRQFLAADSVGR